MAANFTLKYNSSSVHIDGLNIRTEGTDFDYAKNACPALSRSIRFCESAAKGTTAAEALKEARSLAVAINKKLCKKCEAAAEAMVAAEEAQAAAEAAAAPAARQLRPGQGESAVGGAWELLYDKPRQAAQVVRNQGQYALVCTKHLTVHRLARLADERTARREGGWCADCQH